jgi:hypothetical protein
MTLLLAATGFWVELSKRWLPGGSQLDWPTVAIFTSGATAVVLAAWLVKQWVRRRDRLAINSPARLLAELATAHGLKYHQRQLLSRLARHHQLSHPAILFVEPALWTSEKLGADWDRCRPELDALGQQLFAA